MKSKQKTKPESRNFGVTVLASVIFVLTSLMALSFYDGSWGSLVAVILLAFIAVLSLFVAISGRLTLLKMLIERLFFVTLP